MKKAPTGGLLRTILARSFLVACAIIVFAPSVRVLSKGTTCRDSHVSTRVSESNNSSKVVILSYSNLKRANLADHSNTSLYEIVRCNHMVYAEKFGYDYDSPEPSSTKWTASRFVLNGLRYKTFSILSNFDVYDVIVWIDHDAVFYNMSIKVEDWLRKMDLGGADMLMAEDLPGYRFNAGLQIIKTTPWTRMFYANAVDDLLKTDIGAGYIEQPIFYKLYDTLPQAKDKIQIFSPRALFQAFLKVETDFQENSWVVHGTQCGCDLSAYVKQQRCLLPVKITTVNKKRSQSI